MIMEIQKSIPNVLTSLRMTLTFVYLFLMNDLCLHRHDRACFVFATTIFALICATDFMDGRIARKLNATSSFGALLDVAADFVFIISSLIVLIFHNVIPAWVLVMILVKFTEFLVTSHIVRNYGGGSNTFFMFDCIGRIAAVNYYLAPAIASFACMGLDMMYVNMFIYATLMLALMSSSARCMQCYEILRMKVPLGREHITESKK